MVDVLFWLQHTTQNTQHTAQEKQKENERVQRTCPRFCLLSCLVSHAFIHALPCTQTCAHATTHNNSHTHTHHTPTRHTHTHTPHSQLTWRCCCLQLEGEKAGWFCVRTHVTPNHAIPVHTIHRRIHRFSAGPQIGFPPLHRARKKGNSLLLSCVCVFLFVVCVFFVLFVCLIAHSPHNLPEVASSPGEQQASATMAQCDSK